MNCPNYTSQFLNYTVELVSVANNERVLTSSNHILKAKAQCTPDASEISGSLKSYSVTSLSQQSGGSAVFYRSNYSPERPNGNEALHTAAFYLDNADGDITVQATLDSNKQSDLIGQMLQV